MNCSRNQTKVDSEDSELTPGLSKKPKQDVLTYNDWKEKRRELFEEKFKVEEKSLESTKQTLSLIDESERIGVKTGKELVQQRETLSRVEDKLVTINGHLDESEKHLKSMKNIFSSFKSYFSKKLNQNSIKTIGNDLIEAKNSFENESEVREEKKNNSTEDLNAFNDSTNLEKMSRNETINYWHKSNETNDKIEQNLNEIDLGVERLKQLSLGLGHEIDSQNSLIDRITKESESAELRIQRQNNQMRHLLKQ